jgi:hypothetical protein
MAKDRCRVDEVVVLTQHVAVGARGHLQERDTAVPHVSVDDIATVSAKALGTASHCLWFGPQLITTQ